MFKEFAEKNSVDPSAKNNRGDLGFITRDRMVPEFTQAAFNANEGESVGPVRTPYGYHVIKVLKKRAGKTLEFAEVEARVRNEMSSDLSQAYISNLKKTAKVEVNDKAVEKL
jgi:peptidyl-prolyl cis-trans isomerase C